MDQLCLRCRRLTGGATSRSSSLSHDKLIVTRQSQPALWPAGWPAANSACEQQHGPTRCQRRTWLPIIILTGPLFKCWALHSAALSVLFNNSPQPWLQPRRVNKHSRAVQGLEGRQRSATSQVIDYRPTGISLLFWHRERLCQFCTEK